MQNWLDSIEYAGGPKYAAIADAIAGAVRSGELRPGERLPAQRALATQLGVDLTTVTRAYGLARSAGMIEGAGKLGSFVRHDTSASAFGEGQAESGMNVPPQPAFGLLPAALQAGTATLLRAGRHSPLLQYQPSLGSVLERTAAAAAFTERGLPTAADAVAITAGAQSALHAIVTSMMQRSDRVCCGPFLYPGMCVLAARHGLQLVPIQVDEGGMRPESLDSALKAGASTVYLTPTNDNPTAITMSMERRAEVAQVIRRHGARLIEDDAYGTLPSRPLPPITSLIPDLGWYIAGTSKIISPVLRVAHVRAPSASQAASLAPDLHQTAIMAPPVNAALVTLWLKDGTFERLVAGVRQEAIARQRIVARSLAGLRYAAHPEGYHLWLAIDPADNSAELVAALRSRGLSAVSGDAFLADPSRRAPFLRLSIGGAIDHGRLTKALDYLATRMTR
jgi:DNA-binding transcriptional MocR family regulator